MLTTMLYMDDAAKFIVPCDQISGRIIVVTLVLTSMTHPGIKPKDVK